MSHCAGKEGAFHVASTLNKDIVNTRRCVLGVHRRSPLDDSHLLYNQKHLLWVGFVIGWTAWTSADNYHLRSAYHINDSTHGPHLTMYKTVMCYYDYHFIMEETEV